MSGTPRRRHRELKLCAAIAGGFALAAVSAQVSAQTTTVAPGQAVNSYSLPAGPLSITLGAIARISGQTLVFEEAVVASRRAGSVTGSLTVRQALDQALQGSDLTLSQNAAGALVIGVSAELNKVTVTARRDQAETSFKADRSDTATRSGTDLLDVPASVTIITSKVLETQQATSVREALRNVSGVTFTETPQGTPAFSIRGFSASSATTNGVTDSFASSTNVYGVERIEVLKGPQAILAGGNSLGGGINVVTKKPSADPIRDLTLQYGAHKDATVAGDLSGAVTDDKRLSYRVIASLARADESSAGYDGRKDDYLQTALRWKDASTDLILGASYGKQHLPPAKSTFADRDGTIKPVPSMLLSAKTDGFDVEEKRASLQLEQNLWPSIDFVSRLQYSDNDLHLHLYSGGLRYANSTILTTNGQARFSATNTTTDSTTLSGDHYLRAKVSTGPVSHKVSVGVGHTNFNYEQDEYDGSTAIVATLYPAPVPLNFPDAEAANTRLNTATFGSTRQRGVYFQDLMNYGDWNLLLNWRRTLYTSSSHSDFIVNKFTNAQPQSTTAANTPGAGLVYTLSETVSLYASYSQGFVPQTQLSCTGGIIDPITSRNKELGAKFNLVDQKLSLTTSVFELDQSNSPIYNSAGKCYTVTPAQTTKGLEVDIQGQIALGWNAILNYTNMTLSDASNTKRLFPGFPRNKISLWTTYDIPFVHGLGVGFGLSAQSKSDGTISTQYPFTLPGQAQLDASVFYNQPKWSLTFGMKNIANRQLYGVSTASSYIPVLEGRAFMLTFKRSFE